MRLELLNQPRYYLNYLRVHFYHHNKLKITRNDVIYFVKIALIHLPSLHHLKNYETEG